MGKKIHFAFLSFGLIYANVKFIAKVIQIGKRVFNSHNTYIEHLQKLKLSTIYFNSDNVVLT